MAVQFPRMLRPEDELSRYRIVAPIEATSASSLSHPCIVTIREIGRDAVLIRDFR